MKRIERERPNARNVNMIRAKTTVMGFAEWVVGGRGDGQDALLDPRVSFVYQLPRLVLPAIPSLVRCY
jgi:hypothetical protein